MAPPPIRLNSNRNSRKGAIRGSRLCFTCAANGPAPTQAWAGVRSCRDRRREAGQRWLADVYSRLHLHFLPWQLLGELGGVGEPGEVGGVLGAGELTVTVAMAVTEPPSPVQESE